MKTKILFTILTVAITLNVIAQKSKSKEVKTKYLSLPSYDISQTEPSTIVAEFAMGVASFGTQKLKDTKSTCVPKNGGIKDAVEVTTYYFEIPVTYPESYLIAKSPSGKIVYASEVSKIKKDVAKFGFNKCEYWVSAKLKKDWTSKGTSFKFSVNKKYETGIYNKAIAEAKANVYLSYLAQEFKVYTAKGKNFDYTDLESALEKAQMAYKNIAKAGPNQNDFKLLQECITVWEKELAGTDTENKKSRINKNIAKGLHENCARAYSYMYNFDKAIQHGNSFKKLFGNMHTPRTDMIDALLINMEMQKIAAEKNKSLMTDISALNATAKISSKNAVKVLKLKSTDFPRLKKDYMLFKGSQFSDIKESREKEEEAAIASGELNPYQKYVTQIASGPAILMTMAPSPLTGFPELSELPKEMCAIEGLIQIMILNNKIESIPAEIGNMSELQKLDLSGNKISSIPKEIGNLSNLKTLKLNKNPIESIPKEIANCKNLKNLSLKGSKLSSDNQNELIKLLPNCKIKF